MTEHNALNTLQVKNKPAGKFCDGQGLWLIKSSRKTGKWILRYSIAGKRREMGLGSIYDVSLKQARESATHWRRMLKEGLDPIRERDRMIREATETRPTFEKVAKDCFEARKAELKGDGKNGRWYSPLELHVIPYIGRLEIESLDQNDIKRALSPIWHQILAKRKALGLTQKEFAQLIGLGEAGARTVSGWERGEHKPSFTKLKLISGMDVSVPYRDNREKHKFDFIDLFAGIGGIRLPFQANFIS